MTRIENPLSQKIFVTSVNHSRVVTTNIHFNLSRHEKQSIDNSFLLITIPIFLFGCSTFYLTLKRLESERQFKTIPVERQDLKFDNYFTNLGWRLSSKTDKKK